MMMAEQLDFLDVHLGLRRKLRRLHLHLQMPQKCVLQWRKPV
jgi:hypothetical protein